MMHKGHILQSWDILFRVDVEALQISGQSLMPEGMEKEIDP